MSGTPKTRSDASAPGGFTLIEVVLAVGILAVVSVLTYMSFGVVTTAWKRGMDLGDDLHHGDYVLEQLVMGLRSAYQPGAKGQAHGYGLVLEDDGSGPESSDVVSWVKLGSALVGKDCPFAGSPHRAKFWVGEDARGVRGALFRAWRLLGQPEDFDPDKAEPVLLATRVVGFNCRCAEAPKDGKIEWEDEWEDTNKVPPFLELTLRLAPFEEDGEPIEVKRIVAIPVVTQEAR
jgi:prepilin-type N-terminal cleavage/methylation domain-containing protein